MAKAKRYGRWWLLKGLRKEVAAEAGYQQEQREQRQQIKQLTDSTTVLGNYNQQLREKESAIVVKKR